MTYLTTGEAARLCGVQLNTIKNWIRSGEVPAIRTPGGHWRIPRAGFLAFMERMGIPVPEELKNDGKKKPSILIIDDDPAAHELMSGILGLELPDCDIHSAFDGYTGLIDIGKYQPDLILLDIMLPEINGLEIIHRLKQPDSPMPDARIIAVTAASDRKLVVNRIRAAGPEALLFKPLDAATFAQTVLRVLGEPADSGFCEKGSGI